MFGVVLSNVFRLRWWLPMLILALALVTIRQWLPLAVAHMPALARMAPGLEHLAPYALRSLYALVPITLLAAFWPWHPDPADRAAALRRLAASDLQRRLAEAFRKYGYAVHVRSLGQEGADLLLGRDGQRILVQCRHWQRRDIDAVYLRTLCGLMGREKAHGALFLTCGRVSVEAMRFVKDMPIVLIDEHGLLELLEADPDVLRRANAYLAQRSPLHPAT